VAETPVDRIETLLAAMTLDEKIGQLIMVSSTLAVTGPVLPGDVAEGVRTGRVGSVFNHWGAGRVRETQRLAVEETRLKIPLFFAFDVIHGHRTIFPIPLAEAALFSPDLWERTAREAAVEATEDGLDLVFSPMLDVARDPRWGRISEGPGEDPWIACRMAEAKVRGYQTDDLSAANAVAVSAKHFLAYGAATAGRDYASAEVSDRAIEEVYLPPFAAAVAAGAATVMPAFNDVAGVPMTANAHLLREVLIGRLGFDGAVISDYNAVMELLSHGVAGDAVEAAALALKAGVDMDMMSGAYAAGLTTALQRGLVTQDLIDDAVRRVLRLKQRLGLFDDPYRRTAATADAFHDVERRRLAREVGARSIVLLTNKGVLPLAATAKRIAVVGPLADARSEMLGSWAGAGKWEEAVTILDGLKAALPQAEITYVPGTEIETGGDAGIAAAVAAARGADVVLLCVGEAAIMSGEAASRARPELPGRQRNLAEAVLDLGIPTVALLSSGRPLMLPWLFERAAAVVATWFLGTEAGHAIADVVTGAVNPSGRLPVTWPRDVGQVPIFFGERNTGRPTDPDQHYTSKYIDLPATPQFPFGHGLSYSRFALADLHVSAEVLRPGETLTVEVAVTNTGAVAGEETVFLFIRDPVASVARPLLELKGLAKAALAPGGRQVLRLPLAADALKFPGLDLKPVLEAGDIEILVGTNADRKELLSTRIRVEL
jgi:beta-glucosidase